MAEYRLTPAAELDIEGVWTYTFQHWGVDQANRYTDMLTDIFEDLAHAPKAARYVITSGPAIVDEISNVT